MHVREIVLMLQHPGLTGAPGEEVPPTPTSSSLPFPPVNSELPQSQTVLFQP